MPDKICVYTICENDSKSVERWYSSVSGADNVFAVVHDAKDDTAEKLLNLGVRVEFTHYQEYDEEIGKQDTLEHAKQNFPDCDFFVYIPINEIADKEILRQLKESRDETLLEKTVDTSKNKICVYTTCYNESKFIDKWLESNKVADHIVVLVHDCKDDSEEKFRKANIGIPISIGHGFYKEWRFDKGKNDALHLAYSLAPECNIFVFTSLDELWEPGWAQTVKKNWISGETQQCWYNFVQNHDEFGHETGATYFNWMISKDPKWHWEYPIHEAIVYGKNETVNSINLFDKVKLQHWPDKKKSRGYMSLHKLRYNEYGDDISLLYLIRENIICNNMKEGYDLAKGFDDEKTNLDLDEHAYIHTMCGICCEYLNNYDEAIQEYRKAWGINNNLRMPLVRAAIVYAKCGAYHKAEELLEKALKETKRTYSWLEDPWDWRSKPFHWLSYIKLKLNKEEEALGYALFASQIDPNDEEISNFRKLLKQYGR